MIHARARCSLFICRFRNHCQPTFAFFKQLFSWNDEKDRLEATREKERETDAQAKREKMQPTRLEGSTECGANECRSDACTSDKKQRDEQQSGRARSAMRAWGAEAEQRMREAGAPGFLQVEKAQSGGYVQDGSREGRKKGS
jgi:hypothetical protein